jgi:hypothetical protein
MQCSLKFVKTLLRNQLGQFEQTYDGVWANGHCPMKMQK